MDDKLSKMAASVSYNVSEDVFHVTIEIPREEIVVDVDGVKRRITRISEGMCVSLDKAHPAMERLGEALAGLKIANEVVGDDETFN